MKADLWRTATEGEIEDFESGAPTKVSHRYVSPINDTEDVLVSYLEERGVDHYEAWNISHHLVHSVLFSVAEAVRRKRP